MGKRITQRLVEASTTNGFQFARYERFSLSPNVSNKRLGYHHADYGKTRSGSAWSVADILREAAREPIDRKKHFPHVIEPQSPTVAYGCDPLEVEDLAKHWITTVKQSNGKKMRADTPSMIGGVISWPPHRSVEEFNEFLAYGVEKLKEIYGRRLRSVVAHYDEIMENQGALHYHFFVVPLDGEDFGVIDKAYAADKEERKRANSAADEKKKKVDKYGKKYAIGSRRLIGAQALVDWQDMIHEKISKKFGLLRTGPRRERWTRDETMVRLRMAESERQKKIAEEVLTNAVEKQAKIEETNERLRLQQLELAYFDSQRRIEEHALKKDFYTQLFDFAEEKARREAEFDRRQKAFEDELAQNERDRLANQRAAKQMIDRSTKIQAEEARVSERQELLGKFISQDPSSRLQAMTTMEIKIAQLENKVQVANRLLTEAQNETAIYRTKAAAFGDALKSLTIVLDQAINWLGETPAARYIIEKKSIIVHILKEALAVPINNPKKNYPSNSREKT